MKENDSCILDPDQYMYLYKISFFSLFSSLYAIYNEYYDVALVPGGVFLTSINYWRKPDYSWRRDADMIYVKFAVIYQMMRAYNAQYASMYYALLFLGISFYPLGIFFYKNNLYWHSTYAHSMIHIIANISNIILYSGYIVPMRMNPFFSYLY